MDNSKNPQIRAACFLAAALVEAPSGLTREDEDHIINAVQSMLIECVQDAEELFDAFSGGTNLHEMFGLALSLREEV